MSDPAYATPLVPVEPITQVADERPAVGFRSSRHTPGFHEVRSNHQTVGVIMRRATGFDIYKRGSTDVVARKHTISAAKTFARAYFAPSTTGG